MHKTEKKAGKAATSVGNDIAKGATKAYKVTSSAVKTAEDGLITAADKTADIAESAIKTLGHVFSKDTFDAVGKSLSEGADKFEKGLAHLEKDVIKDVKALGPLIVSAAEATADVMEAFTKLLDLGACFNFKKIMCDAIFGEYCDCDKGSEVTVSVDSPPHIKAKCVPMFLEMSLSWSTDGKWPGDMEDEPKLDDDNEDEEKEKEDKKEGDDDGDDDTEDEVKETVVVDTDGEYSLKVSVKTAMEFIPTTELTVQTNGKLIAEIKGQVKALLTAKAEADAKFTYTKTYRVPVDPLEFTACADVFCVSFFLQANATLELDTEAQGSAQLTLSAGYELDVTVTFDVVSDPPKMTADVQSSPFTHSESMSIDGSFDGSLSLSFTPQLTILPLPGAPISVKPYVTGTIQTNLDASASISALAGPRPEFLQAVASDVSASVCAALDLNVAAGVKINGIGIPEPIEFSSKTLKDMIGSAIAKLPDMIIAAITKQLGTCSKVLDDAISGPLKKAAAAATKELDKVVPDFKVDLPKAVDILAKGFNKDFLKETAPPGCTDKFSLPPVSIVNELEHDFDAVAPVTTTELKKVSSAPWARIGMAAGILCIAAGIMLFYGPQMCANDRRTISRARSSAESLDTDTETELMSPQE